MTDYLAQAAAYQAGVLDGSIPACRWVRLACDRNRRDLDRQGTPAFPYRFDPENGRRICQMAEMLPHVKGSKAQVIGTDDEGRQMWATIQLEPWQCWMLSTLFGWVHADVRALRRFRVGLILVPRKNAKSTLGAIIALYMLVADGESGAECYSAATTRDQAKVVAELAWEMARRSPSFREFFGIKMGSKTTCSLSVPATASKFMPLSADAHSLDGLNVSFAIVDELHAHKTRGVWDVLDTATGARLQALLLAITTAGVDLGGICHERLGYLHKVLDRVVDDEAFFGINYTIDPEDDYWTLDTARKANPNFGVSVDPDDLARKMLAARHSPAALNDKLTKHFNVWIRSESAWLPIPPWLACGNADLTIESFKKYPCWIGVDLAEVRDIAAIVAIFRTAEQQYAVFGRYYLPTRAIERSPIAQMSGWVREGHLIETDGDQADYQRIEDDILTWCDRFDVREIDFDRALAAQMGQNLKRRLLAHMHKDAVEAFVITVPQTVEVMNPAMQTLERLVLAGHLTHDANPVLTWMMSNVVVERNYKDEIYPRKAGGKDSPNKIDGAVALLTALSRASAAEWMPKRRSVGVMVI
jgi:phage terminase large subunit-like protein